MPVPNATAEDSGVILSVVVSPAEVILLLLVRQSHIVLGLPHFLYHKTEFESLWQIVLCCPRCVPLQLPSKLQVGVYLGMSVFLEWHL